ncbi:hypothetical protein DLREEDagrD3_04790 [Denitratisoma sp. agr-D3]
MSSVPPQSSSSRQLKVLAVDDTATNRQILEVFLGKLGYHVITAENGAIAVDTFAKERPDLVLMDVMMPVMDGYEATRRIKAMAGDRWVPVIFLSALSKDENLVAGMDAGGDDYLAKPINFVVLDAKLRSFSRTLHMQRSLDASLKQMAAVSENIVDGVITIDAKGIITWVSRSTLTIFGYSREEMLGKNVSMLMPEPEASAHDGYLAAYTSGGPAKIIGVAQREVTGLRKNGSTFPLELGVNEMVVDNEHTYVGVVRDISERKIIESRLRSNAERLQVYYDEQQRENQLAQDIMQRMVQHPGLEDSAIRYWVAPANNFSGDIVAGLRDSQGRLYTLLADATGHGLAAAISALPVLTAFYGLVQSERRLADIVRHLNQNLMSMLPVGRFVAATLLCIDPKARSAQIWQGGMPQTLWLDAKGNLKERLVSAHLPLGIVDFDDEMACVHSLRWDEGDQFVLFSDGVIEASDVNGEAYGKDRLQEALTGRSAAQRLDAVRQSLRDHTAGIEQQDDISLMLIDCRA